jgi:DNA polymerase III subunit epsilon
MNKVLYIDVETTGLKPDKHDVIELGYIIEIDGVVKVSDCLNMQPFSYDNIDPEALKVSGHTIEKLKTYPMPQEAYRDFTAILGKYCDKYDSDDKFYPSGFNCAFDLEFMNHFFLKNNDKYFGSWQNWRAIDPRAILVFLNYAGKISLPKYSLEETCKYFDIPLDAHSAKSDIEATRLLVHKLSETFKDLQLTKKEANDE